MGAFAGWLYHPAHAPYHHYASCAHRHHCPSKPEFRSAVNVPEITASLQNQDFRDKCEPADFALGISTTRRGFMLS
jgi:hypothetical protein